jgi:hypothetical protein
MAAAIGLTSAQPASASCVSTPLSSAYRFTGTVTHVSNAGRTATVRTDDGRTVTVRGSQVERENAASTVDRAYQMGVRYEFHPVNGASPFQDNACTATHPIAATDANAGMATSKGPSPAAGLPQNAGGGSAGSTIAIRLGGAVILAAGAAAWLFRRRARRPD